MDNGSNVILWKSTGGLNQLWNISITTSIQFPFLNNLNEYSIDSFITSPALPVIFKSSILADGNLRT